MKKLKTAGVIAARFLLCIGCITAEGALPGLSANPGDRRALLLHMERAERSERPEAWEGLFRDEVASVPDWETSALAAEFENRFGRWLGREWAAGLPGPGTGEFLREIDRMSLAYIMETDDEGRILRDGKGDPLFKGMENFTGDEAERRTRLEAKMEELLAAWEREASAECQELLSAFSGPLRNLASVRLSATMEEQRRAVRGEFERLNRQGQACFLSARIADSFSLRKKSEEKNAEETARRLVLDAGAVLTEAKNMLAAGLPAVTEEPGKITLRSETWQEDFKREFERGIGEWTRAEERFFAERIRWETESQKSYVLAETAWDSAFSEFTESRGEWMSDMRELLERGRLAWDRNERDFLSDYGRVMTDLAAASAAEIQKLREETSSYLEVYRRSLELVITAEENGALIEAEISRLTERGTVLDRELSNFDAAILDHEERIHDLIWDTFEVWTVETFQEDTGSYSGEVATGEGRKLLRYFDLSLPDYLAMSDESRTGLIGEYNEKKRHADTVAELRKASAEITENEIHPRLSERQALLEERIPDLLEDHLYWTGPGGIRERFEVSRTGAAEALSGLEADIRSYGGGAVTADSLDREIDRMRGYLALKTAQAETARAVLDYAEDTSSSRPTEAQTEVSLRTAENDFAEAEAEYRRRLSALDAHTAGNLAAAGVSADSSKELVSAAAEDLEAARSAYEDALSVFRSKDTAVLRAVMEGYDEELARYYGTGPGSRQDVWEKYAAAGDGSARAELDAKVRDIIRDIEGSGDFNDFPDLPDDRSRRILEVLRKPALSAGGGEEFLSGIRDDEALLRVWEDYGRLSPALEAMYRAGDTLAVRTLMAGADFGSREGVLAFSHGLAALEHLPAYLTEALARWVSVKVRSLGLSLPAAELSGSEADYGGLFLFVTGGKASALEKAGALAGAGVPGAGEVLIASVSEYLYLRRGSAEPSADDALHLSEALALAGLGPDALSPAEADAILTDSVGESVGAEAFSRRVEESLRKASGEITLIIAREGLDSRSAAWLKVAAAAASSADRLETDVSAFRAIVEMTLEIFSRGNSNSPATSEEAKRLKYGVLAGEKNILRVAEAKKNLEADLAVLQTDREAYETEVLEGKRMRMDEAGEKLSEARRVYGRALEDFAEASETYTELKAAADGARTVYGERRLVLEKARGIRDYAAGGYTPAGCTPEEFYERLSAGAGRARAVLDLLETVKKAGERPLSERMDGEFQAAKETEKIRLDALQYLASAEEGISREAAEIGRNISTAAAGMGDAVSKIFSLRRAAADGTREPLFFIPEADIPGAGTLTDFRYADESAFADAAGRYLSGDKEEAARRLSADVALWIRGLSSFGPERPEDLLRDFGLAYYYDAVVQDDLAVEGAPVISTGLFGNQSWQKLIADYAALGPYTEALVDGEGVVVGYETRYPRECRTVEDYLAEETREVYEKIGRDENLFKLYSFYKMMTAADNLSCGTACIGKDLGDLVFDHVDSRARRKQDRYLDWWRVWAHQEGRRIRALRADIEDARETGAAERRALAEALEAFTAADDGRTENTLRLVGLLGGGGGMTGEGFLRVLEEKTGRTPGTELRRITEVLYPGLNERQRDNALTILDAIAEGTRIRKDLARSTAEEAAGRLQSRRTALYREYRDLIEGGTYDVTILRRMIEDLYKNPAFTGEDYYDYNLLLVKSIRSETRRGYGEKLEALGAGLEGLMKCRLDAASEADRDRLSGELRNLRERRDQWELQIEGLRETGSAEWQAGAVRLAGMRKRWREEYAEEYGEKSRLWDMKFLLFNRNRNSWIQAGADHAVTAGAEGLAKEFGLDKDRLMSEIERVRIPDISAAAPDLRRTAARALDGNTMENLIRRAAGLASRAESDTPLVAVHLPAARNGTGALRHLEEFTRSIGGEIYRRASLAAALEMAKAVKETEEGIADTVLSANRRVEKNLGDTLRGAGYQRSGRMYSRRAVIDETLLGGIERESQTIEGYRYFAAPEFRHGADLSREGLEGRSGDYIAGLIRMAQKNLSKYLDLLFGRDGTKRETWDWDGVSGVKNLFEEAGAAYEASDGAGRMRDGGGGLDGLFSWHVGYLPVMDPKNAEKVKEAGYGELGRIMALYLRNEARLGRGLAGFDISWYAKRLWDDDKDNDGNPDGLLAAPTVRSLTDVAVSIAATATGNLWLAAAVNMMDDAAFTMMDAAAGKTDLGGGLLALGKQAGIGAAGLGIGAGMGALGNSLGTFGGDMFGKTLLKGTEILANNAAAGAVKAAKAGKNGLWFDGTVFRRTVLGSDALAALAGGMAGTFLEGGLEGLGRDDIGKVRSFADFSGTLVRAGTGYCLSGETKLNLADFAMFGMENRGRVLSGGLLDLRLGGRGLVFEIGNSGIDMSIGRVFSALNGMGIWKKNMRIEFADRFGANDFAEGYSGVRRTGTALRSLLSFGDEAGRSLLDGLLSGGKTLRVGYTGGRGETAGNEVHLAGLGNSRDLHTRLAAGTVLQHEAYRDGIRVGEIQADGTRESRESNFEELKAASIARLRMAAGIDGDYAGFLQGNRDLLFETFLYAKTRETGGEDLFLNYLAETYRNGEDYYFPEVSTGGEYQNREDYTRYPLLASRTEEAVRAFNSERMDGAVTAYMKHLAKESGHSGGMEDFILSYGMSRELLAAELESDPELQKRFEYRPLRYESLASDGCMMMAAMYGAETLSGMDLSAPEVNAILREAGLYTGDSDLSAHLLGRVMEVLTKGEYSFELLNLGGTSPDTGLLKELSESPDTYLAHLRIKRNGSGSAYHSEMLSSLDWDTYFLPGSAPGLRGVHTANPWRGNGYTGNTYRTAGEIARWDIYRAEPTWRYYFNRSSDWGLARN